MNLKKIFIAVLAFLMLTATFNTAPTVFAEGDNSSSGTTSLLENSSETQNSSSSTSSQASSLISSTTSSTISSTTSSSASSSTSSSDSEEKYYSAKVNGSGVNIRSEANSESNRIASLDNGDVVTIRGEIINGSDGLKWYKIEYANDFAYVCADYLTDIKEKTPPAEYVPDATFEENLEKQKFPETYKELLRQLHAVHPNWIFLADHLDLTWSEALEAESLTGKSLVSKSRPDSYKSMDYGAYNWEKNSYVGFDGSSWVTAHKDIVAYYMEPRNFLNENSIYMFLDQSFDSKLQNIEGINKIIADSFMAEAFPEKSYKSYAELLFDAGKKSKVNPYVLSAMIIQEQGRKGESGLISGTYKGYKGYYNHFNIGAYASGDLTAVQRGLKYAKGELSSDATKKKYGLPWNSITKSILGGSIWYGSGYIEVGQDTLYYKKFDFIGPNFYNHQYMSNIEGAYSEARILKNAYADLPADTQLTFSIPVFKNMPKKNKTSLPVQSGANNYYLESVSVGDLSLTPKFDKYTYSYELVVDTSVTLITVSAKAVSGAKVSGTGEHELKEGENIITLTVTAASGRKQEYTLSVARREGGAIVIPEPKITVDSYNFGKNVTGIEPGTSVKEFKSNIEIANGTMKLLDKNGKEKTKGNISTGDRIIVYQNDNKEFLNKNIVVYGDVSGDGKVSILDLANIQKHILKVKEQSGVYFTAADTNKDGKISIIDLANVQKHILKVKSISQ